MTTFRPAGFGTLTPRIFVEDVSDVRPTPFPAFLYVYVDDADATYRRAVAAGARSLEAPIDTPYGDRRAMVEDRWGNTWQIATFVRRLSAPAARS